MTCIAADDTTKPLSAACLFGEQLINAAPNEKEILPTFVLDGAEAAGYPNALRLLLNCGFHPGEQGFYPYEVIMPMGSTMLDIHWQTWPKAFKSLAISLGLTEIELKRKLIAAMKVN
jgi:hypothetical protein